MEWREIGTEGINKSKNREIEIEKKKKIEKGIDKDIEKKIDKFDRKNDNTDNIPKEIGKEMNTEKEKNKDKKTDKTPWRNLQPEATAKQVRNKEQEDTSMSKTKQNKINLIYSILSDKHPDKKGKINQNFRE